MLLQLSLARRGVKGCCVSKGSSSALMSEACRPDHSCVRHAADGRGGDCSFVRVVWWSGWSCACCFGCEGVSGCCITAIGLLALSIHC